MSTSLKLDDLADTVAVLGAGFSVPSGVPPASHLSQRFLAFNDSLEQRVISDNLRQYWERVFGYHIGGPEPSFEDHFTLLDLAANVGHNIGRDYSPAMLRAIRRISIHRVFEILDVTYHPNNHIERFLDRMTSGKDSAIVSLNWDIVVENHLFNLGRPFTYGIRGQFLDGTDPDYNGFPLIKLHGSANWHYCDTCHSTLFGGRGHGKTTLVHRTFLEPGDFRRLLGGVPIAEEMEKAPNRGTVCAVCHSPRTTARVATFSYAKAFDFFPFHASWDTALQRLRSASRWIFIGYSLPEADFAFKHLLKSAQLAGERPKDIFVVVKESASTLVADRYKRFFGRNIEQFFPDGLEPWVDQFLA